MSDDYEFEDLPLESIRSGTTVLVAGPTHSGTRDLVLRMLAGPPDEGTLIITTNIRASPIIKDCERAGIDADPDRTAIIDCGGEESDILVRLRSVSSPADMTGIGMRFSDLYYGFKHGGFERVRTGFCSVSALLMFNELQSVSRSIHTLAGRIDRIGGLGVLLIDPSSHDEREVSTLTQFCSGRIDVRDTDSGPELRVRGLPKQSREWIAFDPLR